MHGEKIMCKARKGFEKDVRFRFSWLTLATVSLLATLVFSSRLTLAQDPNQQVFHSPEEASAASWRGEWVLATIDVCYQLVDAQQQHYTRVNNGEHRYALKFIGDNDGHDGLFSSESGEQSVSPIDALIASAGVENGTAACHDPVSFNGYYFRILTAQGDKAEGGAKSYLVNGRMVDGFAFVAYPAVYRSTGIMTFIVNQNGIVYQKDLGPDTERIANAMSEYDPDSTWERAD
jgi:Protein of unknown function (DUF2950)